MTWVKLSDQFYDDPSIESISLPAAALFVLVLSYCGRHETDGEIARSKVIQLARGTRTARKPLAELEAQNLLIPNSTPDTLKVRSWAKYQPTKAQMDEYRKLQDTARKATAERVAKHRARHA